MSNTESEGYGENDEVTDTHDWIFSSVFGPRIFNSNNNLLSLKLIDFL